MPAYHTVACAYARADRVGAAMRVYRQGALV
ncbi:MAG: hypothetical protein EBW87_03445 [Burkholderiaceae bacterium]|nr:hypothetical protein [Burkholderiaceae bacterium]